MSFHNYLSRDTVQTLKGPMLYSAVVFRYSGFMFIFNFSGLEGNKITHWVFLSQRKYHTKPQSQT